MDNFEKVKSYLYSEAESILHRFGKMTNTERLSLEAERLAGEADLINRCIKFVQALE